VWQAGGASGPVVVHFTLADPAAATDVVSEEQTTADGTSYGLDFSVASTVAVGAAETFAITPSTPSVVFGAGNTSFGLSITTCSTTPVPSCDPSVGECVPPTGPSCANGMYVAEERAFDATGGSVTCDASSTRKACRFTNLPLAYGAATGVASGWIHW
jgi:hypothetical protein